jgi:hypothetical protein
MPLSSVGFLTCVFGVGVVVFQIMSHRRTRHWSVASARIVRASMYENRAARDTTYRIDIDYEYVHDGKTLLSSRSFTRFADDLYLQMLEMKEAATPIEVFVDPTNPTKTVLRRGLQKSMIAAGVFIALLGAFLLWLA